VKNRALEQLQAERRPFHFCQKKNLTRKREYTQIAVVPEEIVDDDDDMSTTQMWMN
jgi:hypothetical protein